MAIALPTVMNRLDGVPHAASIARSHTDGGWKLVLLGKQRRHTHACAFCRRIWAQGSANAHTLRERETVCEAVYIYQHPRTLAAQWAEDDLLMGNSMEHIEKGTCSAGLCFFSDAENPWKSSTSPHVLSWCILQLEQSPTHTVSRKTAVLPLQLHYHVSGCHIGVCFMVTVGTQSHWLEDG